MWTVVIRANLILFLLAACTARPEGAVPAPADSEPMTLTEMDAIHNQVQRCWNPPVGAPNDRSMIVELRVYLGPDGSVLRIQEIGGEEFERDGFHRISVEAATRAVERCSPLKLPPKKYEDWKTMILVFDPGEWTTR